MLREAQIDALANHLVNGLISRGIIKPRADVKDLVACVVELMSQNFETEARIDDEADRMAEEQARLNPGVDVDPAALDDPPAPRAEAEFHSLDGARRRRCSRRQARWGDAMKLSEERILYLARESVARLRDEGLAEMPNFALALRQARDLIAGWEEQGDAIDEIVRRKIISLKRGVVEGSSEWNILFRRYRDEELRKKGPR